MKRNEGYLLAAYELFKLVDFEVLDESLNGGDREYAEDVINLLMMAHQKIYGDPALPEEGEETVIHPALFLDEESGREWLGLAKCSVIPLPKEAPVYEMLKGRLLKVEAIQAPAEYRTLSHYSEEEFAGERSVTISVVVGKNCLMRSCADIERDDEKVKEGVETEGEHEEETEEQGIGLTE